MLTVKQKRNIKEEKVNIGVNVEIKMKVIIKMTMEVCVPSLNLKVNKRKQAKKKTKSGLKSESEHVNMSVDYATVAEIVYVHCREEGCTTQFIPIRGSVRPFSHH